MQRYTARQAIFSKYKRVVAYELLYRDSEVNRFPTHVSDDIATSSMLVNAFLDTSIDVVTESKTAFINFSEKSLLKGFTSVAPNKKVVIEILETVEPTDEMYRIIRELFHARYRIALDDYTFDPRWERFLKFISFVKVDIQSHPLASVAHEIENLKKHKVKLLAEKVETNEEFKLAREMGFDYFQGYFFCKPQVIKNKGIDFSSNLLMQIYTEAVRAELDFDKLDRLFRQDLGLSTKLLRYVKNVSSPRLKGDITSIRQALVRLGVDLIRRFTLVLVTSELTQNKPNELMKTSIYRARFCEQMLKKSPFKDYSDRGFLAGLFSTLDAVLDLPIGEIMNSLPIDKDIKLALVQNVGLLAGTLNIIKHYEQGEWEEVDMYCQQIGLNLDNIRECYDEAITWQRNETHLLVPQKPKAA